MGWRSSAHALTSTVSPDVARAKSGRTSRGPKVAGSLLTSISRTLQVLASHAGLCPTGAGAASTERQLSTAKGNAGVLHHSRYAAAVHLAVRVGAEVPRPC